MIMAMEKGKYQSPLTPTPIQPPFTIPGEDHGNENEGTLVDSPVGKGPAATISASIAMSMTVTSLLRVVDS